MSFNLLSDYSLEYVSYYDIVSYRNILCIQLFSTALFSIRHYVGEGQIDGDVITEEGPLLQCMECDRNITTKTL